MEHPIVKSARLKAEKAKRKADKARNEFFAVLRFWGTVLIVITSLYLSILSIINK